jgi:cytochrome P450
VTQWAANRSALNFARPNDFLPERWLSPEQFKNYTVDDEILDLDIFAHDVQDVVRPFSAGGRDCMGQNLGWVEFRLLLARMVWNFDIAPHQPAKGASLETSSFRNWSDQKAFLIWQKEPYHVLLKEVAR